MNETASPTVSVLIPVYNGELYLAETIESVLSQSLPAMEIIVVDDGSTDRSVEVASSFGNRVRCINRPHMGLAATRNAAIAAASGQFLLHLDADDILVANSIETSMQALAPDNSPDGVVGRFSCFFSPELSEEDRARYKLPVEPQQGHLVGAAIVSAEAFVRFGGLDESLKSGADLDWFIKAKEAGIQLVAIPDIVFKRRIHGANMSLTQKQDSIKDRFQILKRSLDRRRDAGSSPPPVRGRV